MDPAQEYKRQVEESGQSPGVKWKMPLHIVHTISISADKYRDTNADADADDIGISNANANANANANDSEKNANACETQYFLLLRLFIERPARPWGVSLWQFSVYGWN